MALYPFGFLHIMRALRKNNRASFYLIGIDPAYQNKGVTAILFDAIQKMFNAQGITDVETNPELEENNSIQLMWKTMSINYTSAGVPTKKKSSSFCFLLLPHAK